MRTSAAPALMEESTTAACAWRAQASAFVPLKLTMSFARSVVPLLMSSSESIKDWYSAVVCAGFAAAQSPARRERMVNAFMVAKVM